MLRLILPLLFLALQSALAISREEYICSQDIDKGRCMAYEKRYAFIKKNKHCEPFVYGGCEGNKNNFKTLDECREMCQKECTLKPDSGRCTARFINYYYDKETRRCEEFVYGGCGGNANNYRSKEDCEARCAITNKAN